MPTFKDQLNRYMQTKESTQEIDVSLKQSLHTQLTKAPKRHWWKLSVPVVTVAVLGGIVFYSNTKQTDQSLTTLVTNSLRPQEALAAALEKMFTLDTFASTFGLANDGQLHHLELEHSLLTPSYQSIDGTVTPAAITESAIDIWSQDNNIKIGESKQGQTLLNAVEGKICSNNGCKTLEQLQQYDLDLNLSDHGWFYPITTETMISDLSLEAFFDELNGPGLYVSWSTLTPIFRGQFVATTDSFIGGTETSILGYDSHGMKWYRNDQYDGKYWHRMPLYHRLEDNTNTYYIQILEVDNADYFGTPDPNDEQTLRRGSMIYQLNYDTQTILPVSPDTVTQSIRDGSVVKAMLTPGYYRSIQPALYVLRHINDLGEPSSVTTGLEHGQVTQVMQYILPDSYTAELNTTYSGQSAEGARYTMDIYLDQTATQFLGYTVKEDDTILESLWLTDTILPNDQAADLFSTEQWPDKSNSIE